MTTVVLTAAVTPNVAGAVVVADPKRRLADYVSALRQWRDAESRLGFRTIVVETTGFGAQQLLDCAQYSSGIALDITPSRQQRAAGKGAVEAGALNTLMSSDLLAAREIFVKVTGRLTLCNADPIIASLVDHEAITVRMTYGTPWADTRAFAMTPQLWQQYFEEVAARCDDPAGTYLEQEVGRCALIALANGVRVLPFERRPRWKGTSGSTGAPYSRRPWSPRESAVEISERALVRFIKRKQL